MGEENKTNKGKTSIVQLCKEFGENTSMHGIGRAVSTRSRWKRLIWTVMVLCGVGWSIFQFMELVTEFYTYPVTTELKMRHETRMRFPAITICNLNRMRSSQLSIGRKKGITNLRKEKRLQFENEINRIFRSIRRRRIRTRHQTSDMLIDCMFNRRPCSADNFTYVDAAIDGWCHCFFIEDSNLMYTTRAGPLNGLILELNIEHGEYLPLPSTAGFFVMVNNDDEVVYPEDGGILVHPGMTTSIGIKKTVTRRLPPPYGNCVDSKEAGSADLNQYKEINYTYTEIACRKSCYQDSLIKKCNCCDDDFPCERQRYFKMAGITPKKNQSVRYCNNTDSFDNNDWHCLSELEHEYMTGELKCSEQCPPACNQTTFETIVSTALWPADPYLEIFVDKVNETMENMTFQSTDDIKQFIQKNFLRLEIYFQSLGFVEIITKPMYDWNMLLGNIGGQMGLWLGFSVLTAIELAELCTDAAVLCVRNLYRKYKTRTYDVSEGKPQLSDIVLCQ